MLGKALLGLSITFAMAVPASAAFPEGLLVIAHRGIVTETITENSLASLEECIRRGYTHMEVDLRPTKDGHAVALHDRSLKRTYGINAYVDELTLAELRERVTEEQVPTLEAICKTAEGRLNLMPDIKECPDVLLAPFTESIRTSLEAHDLLKGALFIGIKEVGNAFLGQTRLSYFGPIDEAKAKVAADPNFAQNRFAFAHAKDFTQENVTAFQVLGLPVVVSINTFHYLRGNPDTDGPRDVKAMQALGVDGLQIDSVYESAIE